MGRRRDRYGQSYPRIGFEMRDARRILMATWDGAGNNPPITTLASALVAQGDDVHVLGHESTRGPFEETGSTFIGWASSSQPPFIREFIPQDQEYAYAEEHIFFGKSYQSDLRPVIEKLGPDVVMVDVNLRYGVLEGLRVGQPIIVLCHILYGAAVQFDDMASPYLSELTRVATLDGVPDFSSRRAMMDLADRVLVFSYADFDPVSGAEAGENVIHVGPLRAVNDRPSSWLRRFPDRRLVVIALSTSDQNQGETLQRLCDACAPLDIEAVVTTGPMIAPEELDTSENVTAIDFVNHDEVLPRADLLVTHAGHGTVAAALANGVPMLCIPFGRDQNFNADRVETLGLGTVLDPDSPTDVLRRAVRDMLDDDALKNRARRFSDSLRAHPGIQDALTAIEGTINGT
jgi:MGT family glycosyltransferase